MKIRHLAFRVTMHSALMLLGVYVVMQVVTFFRDNIILGIGDLSSLPSTVFAFLAGSVIPPILLFSVIVYLVALPLQRVHRKLLDGEVIDPAEAEKTRRRIMGFSRLILGVNLAGFALGYILSQVLSGKGDQLLSTSGLVVLFSNLAGGVVYASAQSALNNLAFAELRERLGIRDIGKRKRELRSTLRQLLLTVYLVFYVLTFMQFNSRDLAVAQDLEQQVLNKVRTGEIAAEEAAQVYRDVLSANIWTFSTRANLDVSTVPLPWERTDSVADRQQAIFFLYAIFIFLIAVGIQTATSLDMRDQIVALQTRLQDVLNGGGDLKKRINLRSMDDIGEVTAQVNQLLEQFQGVVLRIGKAAGQTRDTASSIDRVLAEAEAVVGASEESFDILRADLESQVSETKKLTAVLESFGISLKGVDSEAERQRSFVTETSSAMEEMASNIQSVERMTDRAGSLTVRLSEQGSVGGASVSEASLAIEEIRRAAGEVLKVLGSLNKIASSTNMLAMNASIEAAHAGDQGKGFAVVAEEVRTLANDASSQTKQIRELIKDMAIRVERGVATADASGKILQELVTGLKEAADISTEISRAMKEQAIGTRSAADSLQQIVKVSDTIHDRMEEQESETKHMNETLDATISRLDAIARESRHQAESVHALQTSFAQVRKEVDGNMKAVQELHTEISRYQVE